MSTHFQGKDTAPRAIDLFAGCGGLTEGLMRGGFRVTHAYEKEAMARTTYHLHHCEPHSISLHADATQIREDLSYGDVDLIAGGPPCQDFSHNAGETVYETEQNLLPFVMVEWANAHRPKILLIENVEGMQDSHKMTVDELVDEIEDTGYRVRVMKLNAMKYGVPQARKRVFFVCIRNDINPPNQWKPPIVCNEGQRSLAEFGDRNDTVDYMTSSEALESLPEPLDASHPADDPIHHTLGGRGDIESNRCTNHRVDPLSLSKPIKRGGKEVWMPTNHKKADHSRETQEKMATRELGRNKEPTTSRRLDPDKPAPTMTISNGTPPIHYAGRCPSHPERDVNKVRRMTVREVARIQGFRDEFTFAGTKTQQFQQVANAVPPKLGHSIALHLRRNVLRLDNNKQAKASSNKKRV